MTFMVYLNDDFHGGDTCFEDQGHAGLRPDGELREHQLLHEGAAVARGRKYVLRTDVMYTG